MTGQEVRKAQARAVEMLEKARIVLNDSEKERIEVCDYDLGNLESIGTQIVIYVNTKRCCAKELVLFPWQLCPQHIHIPFHDYPGKEETFRCRWGEVYLYVPGEPTEKPKARVPEGREKSLTVWHEIILKPGQQYTLKENTLHWFQAGPEGAIISEFSTASFDDRDIFTDPDIRRISNI
jgi:D-lyxose ketol-isomerase